MLYIYGYGGFAREVAAFLPKEIKYYTFVVDDEYYKGSLSNSEDVVRYSEFIDDWDDEDITIAIGDPHTRMAIANKLFKHGAIYKSLHLRKSLFGLRRSTVLIRNGNIFCPGSILTTDIKIGEHNHFNLNSTIGHDCVIGSFNTFSPGANISGNVKIGNLCYFGTNSAVKEGVSICDNVTIGMGAVVLNDITEPGTYVGVPCKKIYSAK